MRRRRRTPDERAVSGAAGHGPGFAGMVTRETFVIWFYAKHGHHVRCEVRAAANGNQFDLVITDADGSERVERFEDSASVTQRTLQLEAEWIGQGWDGPFGREY